MIFNRKDRNRISQGTQTIVFWKFNPCVLSEYFVNLAVNNGFETFSINFSVHAYENKHAQSHQSFL